MEANFHYPAEYYDEDYTVGIPHRKDIPFYSKYAAESGGPVLELGCGTGRILIPIAQSGIECYGLDMSSEMLEVCDEKIRKLGLSNVHTKRSSMDNFHYDRTFRMIYIPFRSFQHLRNTRQQVKCLQLVHEHLDDDGLFIMDVFSPNIEKLAEYSRNTDTWEKDFSRKNERTEHTITRYFQARADLGIQIIDVEMKWEERTPDGSLIAKKDGKFQLRYLFRYELEHLLIRCGFQPEIYGYFFEQRPFDSMAREMIAVCRKSPR